METMMYDAMTTEPTNDALLNRLRQEKFVDATQEAVLNLLVAAATMRDRIEATCMQHGISHQQYNVLRILRGAHPGGHARCQIVDRLIDRASDVTRLIDRLEEAGYAIRERSMSDRRLSITRITQKGIALLDRMQAGVDRTHAFVAARLSHAEQAQLSRILVKLFDESRGIDAQDQRLSDPPMS